MALAEKSQSSAIPAPRRRSPGRPKRSEVEQRNRDLLERALEHFLERGFEGTTIRGIAASLGMAKRTIYVQYGDKLTLFKAALRRAIEDWIVPVSELEAAEDEDVEASLRRIALILVDNILSPAGMRLIQITNTESYRMPEIGVYTFSEGTRPTIHYLADMFGRRLRPGADRDELEELAVAFLNLVIGPARMAAWGFVPDRAEIERLTGQRVALFLHGSLRPQG